MEVTEVIKAQLDKLYDLYAAEKIDFSHYLKMCCDLNELLKQQISVQAQNVKHTKE